MLRGGRAADRQQRARPAGDRASQRSAATSTTAPAQLCDRLLRPRARARRSRRSRRSTSPSARATPLADAARATPGFMARADPPPVRIGAVAPGVRSSPPAAGRSVSSLFQRRRRGPPSQLGRHVASAHDRRRRAVRAGPTTLARPAGQRQRLRVRLAPSSPHLPGSADRCWLARARVGQPVRLQHRPRRLSAPPRRRPLVVPFADGRENEQTRRAGRLASRGLVRVLPSADLTPEHLAHAIRDLLHFEPSKTALRMDGAPGTSRPS